MMNIEVCARIRSLIDEDHATGDDLTPRNQNPDGSQQLLNNLEGNGSAFYQIFKATSSNRDIFDSLVKQLLTYFISGWNSSCIITGSKGSGGGYTLAGNESTDFGLVDIVLQQLFIEKGQFLDEVGERRSRTSTSRSLPSVSLLAYDISGEDIVDLLAPQQASSSQQPKVQESPERGTYVENLTSMPVKSSSEGHNLFHQAWTSHIPTSTAVIQLELNSRIPNTFTATKSYLSFIVIPIPVSNGSRREATPGGTQVKQTTPSVVSQTYTEVTRLVAALASKQDANRVIDYSGCALTKLLQDVLGGNCFTQVIMCFEPPEDPESVTQMIKLANNFSKVKNFPIVNEEYAQLLLKQYRARLMQSKDSPRVNETTDVSQLNQTQAENVRLPDSNERLQQKLEELQDRYTKMAASISDLSTQLLVNGDARLRMSKTLIDMQRESIDIREAADATNYKLANKIRELEIALDDAEVDKKRLTHSVASANTKLEETETQNKEIADKYARLESSNIELREALDKQVDHNDKLGLELLKMLNSPLSAMEPSDGAREKERVRAVVNQLTKRTEDLHKFDDVRTTWDKPLFEAINKLQLRLDQERNEYTDEQSKMQDKIVELRSELNEERHQTRVTQAKLSELNAQLLTSLGAKSALETQMNKQQHKLKEVTDDFRSRLNKYIQDIAAYMDTRERRATSNGVTPARMDKYVDQMLDDMKRAHGVRESQLSSAAISYKRRLEQVVRQHEVLLVAYSDLRQQVEARGLTDVELGPNEHKLVLYGEPELQSSQQRQIEKLQNALIQKQAEIDASKLRRQMDSVNKDNSDPIASDENGAADKLSLVLHQQLQEFMQTSEKERARLFADNEMLKCEVTELQEYVDKLLSRYRDELTRQRQLKRTNGSLAEIDRRTPVALTRFESPPISTRRRR